MNVAVLEESNGLLVLKGTVQFDNVVSLLQQGITFFNKLNDIKVDLKGLSRCDSSGLALLTAWVREARRQNKAIVFIHMPSFMQDILRVCGLDGVLPVIWEN